MEQRSEIENVRAEMLLSYLYPELNQSWRVQNRGTFYRNYSEDMLSFDPEKGRVELSRDGLMRLLPPRLVSGERTLDEVKQNSDKEAEELRLLEEMFVPIDSILFRLNMSIEQSATNLLLDYEGYILKEYFGFDVSIIENRYLKRLLPLLPYVQKFKVDYHAISNIIEEIVGYRVSFKMDSYSESERADVLLLRVTFIVEVEGLSGEEFRSLNEELTPLFDTIREWFIPFDQIGEFRIRDLGSMSSSVGEVDILSYNTRI